MKWIARFFFLGSIWGLRMLAIYGRYLRVNLADNLLSMLGLCTAAISAGYLVYHAIKDAPQVRTVDRLYPEILLCFFPAVYFCMEGFFWSAPRYIQRSLEVGLVVSGLLLFVDTGIRRLRTGSKGCLVRDLFQYGSFIDKSFWGLLGGVLLPCFLFLVQRQWIALVMTIFMACLLLCCLSQAAILRSQIQALKENRPVVLSDTLVFSFRQMEADLLRVGETVHAAVEGQLASERLKTELITNVSHDIKTPLTSVINYVDLLKKEKIQNPRVESYLEVLDRKSQRLKVLIADLVEASKAGAGNLELHQEFIRFQELIDQVAGDYDELLSKRNLSLVLELPEKDLWIHTDGQYLFRILENFFSNAGKYAMEHTRLYGRLDVREDTASFSLKNVSAEPLNFPAEELMERFVRGDKARKTEGSGLGLYIAQSLAALLGGKVTLTINGDLFIAEVCLPLPAKTTNTS